MSAHRTFVFIHRWSGVVAAVLLVVAGLTGSAITFRAELDRWLNSDMLRVTPGAERLGADALVQRVEAKFEGASVTSITTPDDPDDAWVFALGRKSAGAGEGRAARFSPGIVYADPYSGEVTGTRERGQIRFDRSGILLTLYDMHHDLFLGLAGHWILAIAAAIWLVMSLIGVYIAIKQAGGFRRAFRVEGQGDVRHVLLDLHRSLGLVTVIAVAVIALSGIYLNLRPEFTTVVEWFSRVTPAPERAWPGNPVKGPGIGFERAIAEAELGVPYARVQSISINRAKGFYRVRMGTPEDVNIRGDTFAYVSAEDGRVIEVRDVMKGSGGDVFLAWQRPLHSGEALGLPGRSLVFVIGLLPVFLAASGIYLWLRRKLRPRSAVQRDTPALRKSNAENAL